MPSSIVQEGVTVDEAVETALATLKTSRANVQIEIMQEPSTKMFGLKKEPAIVRVTVKEKSKKTESDFATVSIVDGKLIYTEAQTGQGPAPRLIIAPELKVFYKGEHVTGELELSEGLAPLEIIFPTTKEPQLDYELKVNADQTKAELFWSRAPGVKYTLSDHTPSNVLPLRLEQTLIEPPALTVQDVSDILIVEEIEFGLMLDTLTQEQLNTPNGALIVAKGKAPIPPTQPSITYVFQEEPAFDQDALRIDYYEVHGISGVKPGAILATKQLGQPGVPGTNIYGKPIPTEPLRKLEIKVGEGVALSDDGLQAIATVSGLPSLHGDIVRVTSVFELQGDADASTGNITMDGNIIIKGNVLDSVKVESNTGDIVVNGLVSGALLRTGGSITVLKNVVRSQLLAGGTTVIRIRFLTMLTKIATQLEDLVAAYETIVSRAANVPFENLIKHLLELKFFELPKDIKLFVDYAHQVKAECSEEMEQLATTLSASFLGLGPPKLLDIDELKKLVSQTKAEVYVLEGMALTEANVSVGYLQNSSIEASGKVTITGKGCFYSDILAGKGFSIVSGVFRGGELVISEGKIVARELGGPTGTATLAQITGDGEITVNLVHPNVTVAIQDQSYRFSDDASQVRALLDNGILTVYSGSNRIHG